MTRLLDAIAILIFALLVRYWRLRTGRGAFVA